jgi:hypothetical protein
MSEQTYTHKTIAEVVGTTESTVKFWLKDFRDAVPYVTGDRRQRVLDARFVPFLKEIKRLREEGLQDVAIRRELLPRLTEFGFGPDAIPAEVVFGEEDEDAEITEVLFDTGRNTALTVIQNLGERLEQTIAKLADDRQISIQFVEASRSLGTAEEAARQYQERYEEQRARNLELREENQRLQERLAQLERHQTRGLLSRLFS